MLDERRLELRAEGLRTSQFAPIHPRSLDGRGPIDARGEVGEAQNHLWFPNLKFNVLPGHPNLSIGPVWPTGPETCAGYLDYWFGEGVDERWIERRCSCSTTRSAPRTRRSSRQPSGARPRALIDRGWVLGGTETLIGHFQDYLRERLELDRPSAASSDH